MRIVYFGTPEFSIPTLNALVNSKHKVLAVVTQPDKPNGRKKQLLPTPAKEFAIRYNIPVYQFEKIRRDGIEILKSLSADCFVTCAYGQILSKEILDITKYGVINVHGSLLPKYRGAAPVQWAVINGEKVSGITILKSDVGIDDGPVILQKEINLDVNETSLTLFNKLSILGGSVLLEALNEIENGTAIYTPQNNDTATVCKMLNKEMSVLNFNLPAKNLVSFINGINSWPVAKVNVGELLLKVYKAEVVSEEYILKNNLNELNISESEVAQANSKVGLIIKTCDGFIKFVDVQPENGKIMTSESLLNSKKIMVGTACK